MVEAQRLINFIRDQVKEVFVKWPLEARLLLLVIMSLLTYYFKFRIFALLTGVVMISTAPVIWRIRQKQMKEMREKFELWDQSIKDYISKLWKT